MKTPRANIILGMSTLLTVGIIATGCATNYSKQRNKVYQDWSRSFSELGIFPVFPPREDVVVGDVWALPLHPYSAASIEFAGGLGKTGIWLDRLATDGQVETALTQQYTNSFYPADTSLGGNTNMVQMATWTNPSPDNIFKNLNLRRTRQVAFPEFSFSGIDQGALSALIPIEAFQASFGINHSQISSVTVKIPSAESYGLPLFEVPKVTKVLSVLSDTNKTNAVEFPFLSSTNLIAMRSHFNEAFGNLKSQVPHAAWLIKPRRTAKLWREIERSESYVWVALVSEVFLARTIDITISHTSASGGAASVSPITDALLGQVERLSQISGMMKGGTNTVNMTTNSTSSTNATTVATNSTVRNIQFTNSVTSADMASVLKIAEQLQEFNSGVQAQDNLGGAISVVSVSARTVGLRKTFERPIVVGVRGAVVKLDAKTGKILYHSNTHRWANPTTSFTPRTNPKQNSQSNSELSKISAETLQLGKTVR